MKKIVAVVVLLIANSAHAGGLRSIGNFLAAPVTLPVRMTTDIIKHDDPTQEIKNDIHGQAQIVTRSVQIAQNVHDQIASVPRNLISQNLGGSWTQAYDGLTGLDRVQVEMGFTAGRFLGGCLDGQSCTINQLVAMPVAAALRDAYKIYAPQSQALTPQTIATLQPYVPLNVLLSARIAVGNVPNFTVPGFLNAGYSAFRQSFAVTIGNVMIFSRPPNPADFQDWRWFLHELHHTEQYEQRSNDPLESIDGFAVDYVQHSAGMEADAWSSSDARIAQLCAAYRGSCPPGW